MNTELELKQSISKMWMTEADTCTSLFQDFHELLLYFTKKIGIRNTQQVSVILFPAHAETLLS